jgi:hypothetical protein
MHGVISNLYVQRGQKYITIKTAVGLISNNGQKSNIRRTKATAAKTMTRATKVKRVKQTLYNPGEPLMIPRVRGSPDFMTIDT